MASFSASFAALRSPMAAPATSSTQATGKFSTVRLLSFGVPHGTFPSLRSSRLRICCAAKPETVDKVCQIVRKQLALPPETSLSGETSFAALGADSLDTMDRASILGDAIEYLKELLQRIGELHNELESTPCSSPVTSSTITSLYPMTPSPSTLPWRVKEELSPSPLSSPCSQLPSVEVRERDGQAVNIHMFCARRPGLLLSTMSALDSLGLDIQQAVISCFNGFALDIFRAERCKNDPGVRAEEIKALLLHTAGCHGAL